MEKITNEDLEKVTGGRAEIGNYRTVGNVTAEMGYLAIRTEPAARYENEIQSCKLQNGDRVQITGGYVNGTGFGDSPALYVWVYAPKAGVSGYVNAAYLR